MAAGKPIAARVVNHMKRGVYFPLIASALFTLHGGTRAETPAPSATVRVLIAPECKSQYFGVGIPRPRSAPPLVVTDYEEWDPALAKPFAFKDPRTQTVFYVESDGRHLAAVDRDGNLLWVRNPFEDSRLCPYRTPRPVIYLIEVPDSPGDKDRIADKTWRAALAKKGMDPSHEFIRIYFDSSQFGLVDQANGNFILEGRN